VIHVPTEYTPADLSGSLVANLGTALAWVGAGIGGAVLVLFVFLGIRLAIGFFKDLAFERKR
jgi:hypothetical protein